MTSGNTAAAIVEFLVGPLTRDPVRVGHRLRGELAGLLAVRRGPYRVVYELDEEDRPILILRSTTELTSSARVDHLCRTLPS